MNGSLSPTTIAPDRCPLCGARNSCALATAKPGTALDCWCFHTTVNQAALAQLPPDAVTKACLCPSCARRSDARLSDTHRAADS
ncbi:cysteine-rich CWC family protein [Pseudomonas sp. Marseille-QA0892]